MKKDTEEEKRVFIGYPPDMQKIATELILEQAKRISDIIIEDDKTYNYVSEPGPAMAVADKKKKVK